MSNYLQKYHLKKVEPVKNRQKISYADYVKVHQRAEKASQMKMTAKRKISPHEQYFQNQQSKVRVQVAKTEQHIKNDNNFFVEEPLKNQQRLTTSKENKHQRQHKSLNFKSNKDSSTGTKILNTIQDFLTKIMKSNEGCNCGDPCLWANKFYKWVDVPVQIVKNHYCKTLSKWQQSNNPRESQSQSHSVSNQDSRKSFQATSYFLQNKKTLKQILIDIDRTQSEELVFQNPEFKQKQKRILMCYAIQDSKVGYIQGMNMILSGILFHVKDQYKTYAIFRKIIYQIRNIYLHNFQQCYLHISKIKKLLEIHVQDIHQIFQELGLDLSMICLPWILSLLTCIVPLNQLHLIYDGFIKQKWNFIYRVCLAIFIYHKETIVSIDDAGQIMSLLSATNSLKNSYDWEDIIIYSTSIIM